MSLVNKDSSARMKGRVKFNRTERLLNTDFYYCRILEFQFSLSNYVTRKKTFKLSWCQQTSFVSLARHTSEIRPQKFHSDDVALQIRAVFLIGCHLRAKIPNQSETLHGSRHSYVIRMECFGSNLRPLLSAGKIDCEEGRASVSVAIYF